MEREITQVEDTIQTIVAADQTRAERAQILTSIPGIAKVTALALLIEPPELGSLSGKQVTSLAGLAPISRQSGKWQGKERIQGGQANLRRAIYLQAILATRFNPDMKAKYEQLISAGKCKKQAITAVMRKLVVMANALLRDDREWVEQPARPIRTLSEYTHSPVGKWVRGAAVTYLPYSARTRSTERIAPSSFGIKHLEPHRKAKPMHSAQN